MIPQIRFLPQSSPSRPSTHRQPADGQSSVTGTVTGTSAMDRRGVPGATVRIVNEATRGAVDAVSDGQGAYRAIDLAARHLPHRDDARRLRAGGPAASRSTAGQTAAVELTLTPARLTEGVVVTARRVEEAAQEVPIPLSVVDRNLVENAGAFNVNRLKELIPTVQFYSTNPRNSAINIRGLGAPFGLTNDGLEPGVGLYIDGVFYARPRRRRSTSSTSSASRCCAGRRARCSARTPPPARSTSRRASRASRAAATSSSTSATWASSRPRRRRRARSASKVAGRRVVLGHPARRHGLQRADAGLRQRSRQRRRARPAADRAVRQGGDLCGDRLHAAAAGRLHAGRRRRRADAAAGESPVSADCRGSRLHAAELQRLRSPHRRRHAAALATRTSAGRR